MVKKDEYKVIEAENLGSRYDRRYIVVSKETGEVLDDANGYGYKTIQNAHRGWGYKSMHTKADTKREKAAAKAWYKKNRAAVERSAGNSRLLVSERN